MKLNNLVLKNFVRNLNNYGLYIFALIFSVALFFSLLTLTIDEAAMEEITTSTPMTALFSVGSVTVVIIIILFVMFANMIFIKRRHKELALFQLIGMNRRKIFGILLLENFIIYFGSLIGGILLGFFISRLLLMLLLQIMRVDMMVEMQFSPTAALITAAVFVFIFIVLMIQNYVFLKRSSLIKMLKLNKTSESTGKPIGKLTIVFGIAGILMIALGYYMSQTMFDRAMENPVMLPIYMVSILFLTILGTYITFKCSVAFVLNMVRKSKNGHVNVNDVLSVTSVMFKMRSNAFLLTAIAVITAISITAMSLSYITYYSTDKMLDSRTPYDYTVNSTEEIDFYEELLNEEGYEIDRMEKSFMHYNVATTEENTKVELDNLESIGLVIASDAEFDGFDVSENETHVTGTMAILDMFVSFKEGDPVTFTDDKGFERTVEVTKTMEEGILPAYLSFGMPVLVVDDAVYQQLAEHQPESNAEYEMPSELYAFNIAGGDNQEVFELMDDEENPEFTSRIQEYNETIQMSGMMAFIVGFLGFAFLLTSGCILYFKQIDECEDEKGSYKVLRKLGFSQGEILKGLALKMIISFGIPLIIGLLHSLFAVKSGWFIFGIEMWTPTLIVMGAYTVLYSIFALMSLGYYRKVVRNSI
ncbi:bacitracin export permease protein BceB [Jeotgalicoccus coquinae]|uniref:Bacitracin export permease protein BceB n=1 Tax=Jeotgalicoccus coquinae TaxID=709509 RepID=A0A6V7R8A4_9STAP|nr:ABC transporter permease [Jeotgalicoccus coquinae]MBB6423164.1 bacitracin transport system permease protein [Jeotgalicoccus coquinae]GGE10111.1 bacitracin export permease protein BceB [Jeotgalicoccus coquinae]CAD2073373.1 Bacitracin export permease protein BceB [Jeotgalicoccus coquinae]